MATPVWGLLQKSLLDGETIEEAIVRLILVHTTDPTSHLGASESLQSHKASLIIDHVANSVVRDKITFDRFAIDDMFYTIDAWDKSAGTTLPAISNVLIATSGAINDTDDMALGTFDETAGQNYMSLNPVFLTRVLLKGITNQHVYIGNMEGAGLTGYGFYIHDATLYAYYHTVAGGSIIYSLGNILAKTWYNLECRVTLTNHIEWFVDGLSVYSLADLNVNEGDFYMTYSIEATAAEIKTLAINAYHFDSDYL